MAGTIRTTVVSPERQLFDGEVEHFVVPGTEGELGVYPRHASMIAALGPGVVRLSTRGGPQGRNDERFAIRGGFLHVKKDVATLLVTDTVKPSDIDRSKLDAEYESVLEALRHPRSEEEFAELLVQRRWCEVRLALLGAKTSVSH